MDTEKNVTWHIILNPHAGSGKGLRDKEKIMRIVQQSQLNYGLSVSEYPGHAIQIAKELAEQGCSHFIVAGGDGTLNEVVNGFFNSSGKISDKIVIGMIPVGTGNDWIKTFGIPDDYQAAMDIILKEITVIQDVGEIKYKIDHKEAKRYFVNIVGFGFDAMVATKANKLKEKGVSGFRIYIQSLLASYFTFQAQQTEITIDGRKIDKNLFSASIGIGKYNGGGMMQVPEANPIRGIFHITLISKIGILGILKNLSGLYNGKFIRDRRVSTFTGKEVEIKAHVPLPGEADGESLGASSFNIRILPHQLKVIVGDGKFLT
jgi:YegS/Rv2252/BmrU family lipid kinase